MRIWSIYKEVWIRNMWIRISCLWKKQPPCHLLLSSCQKFGCLCPDLILSFSLSLSLSLSLSRTKYLSVYLSLRLPHSLRPFLFFISAFISLSLSLSSFSFTFYSYIFVYLFLQLTSLCFISFSFLLYLFFNLSIYICFILHSLFQSISFSPIPFSHYLFPPTFPVVVSVKTKRKFELPASHRCFHSAHSWRVSSILSR